MISIACPDVLENLLKTVDLVAQTNILTIQKNSLAFTERNFQTTELVLHILLIA